MLFRSGVQGEGEHAALVGAVLVHFGLVAVEPVLRRAALEAPVVAEEGEVRHQLAAVLPAEKDGQHPAERPGRGDQRFGLEAGTHDDGAVKLTAPLAKVLPGVERAHAVAQQKIGDARIELLRQRSDSVEVVEDGAVAVGLGEAFPGIFRGTFDVHAKEINDEMKFAAATAIASIIPDDQIRADYIIPEAFNPVVAQTVAAAVAEAAKKSGVTREYKTL